MADFKIYPKQFRNDIVSIEKNKCFMIMQFSDDLDMIYGYIKEELSKEGYLCNRADDVSGSPLLINKILKEMLSSRFIIADLTHNNPNVFYELGIAHSFKDPSNIILIKQHGDKCPFDISHLTYIEYSPDNLKYLVAKIKNHIKSNQYLSEFYEILNIRGIINLVCDNQDEFVEYIQAELGSDISIMTDIIANGGYSRPDNIQEYILQKYEDIVKKTIADKLNLIDGVLSIYFELILACTPSTISEIYVNKFINSDFGIAEEVFWKTNLMVKLAENRKLRNICIPWIINYFGNPHVTTVDLNRYKLEKFLMTTNFSEIDEYITNSLFSKNCYLREHMADIIGEKRVTSALHSLYTQLETEDNCYVARSIIQAISKIDNISGIEKLNSWLERRLDEFLEKKFFIILKHVYLATVRLDSTNEKKYVREFKDKYDKYIDDYLV